MPLTLFNFRLYQPLKVMSMAIRSEGVSVVRYYLPGNLYSSNGVGRIFLRPSPSKAFLWRYVIFCLTSVSENDDNEKLAYNGKSIESCFLSDHFNLVLTQIGKFGLKEILLRLFLHFRLHNLKKGYTISVFSVPSAPNIV